MTKFVTIPPPDFHRKSNFGVVHWVTVLLLILCVINSNIYIFLRTDRQYVLPCRYLNLTCIRQANICMLPLGEYVKHAIRIFVMVWLWCLLYFVCDLFVLCNLLISRTQMHQRWSPGMRECASKCSDLLQHYQLSVIDCTRTYCVFDAVLYCRFKIIF